MNTKQWGWKGKVRCGCLNMWTHVRFDVCDRVTRIAGSLLKWSVIDQTHLYVWQMTQQADYMTLVPTFCTASDEGLRGMFPASGGFSSPVVSLDFSSRRRSSTNVKQFHSTALFITKRQCITNIETFPKMRKTSQKPLNSSYWKKRIAHTDWVIGCVSRHRSKGNFNGLDS